ncbi:(2Fe-2S)-binding protein [Candidatus Woesearchaeota archaeon]|nr:(2Fe-2S)-binding protein [Candidatus Woesearchaeota archaeon]
MAIIKDDNKEVTLEDGAEIKDACKDLGVVFGCEDGLCGTCMIEIEEGMENLSQPTQEEKDMGVEGNTRLACQCKINSGTVKIKY